MDTHAFRYRAARADGALVSGCIDASGSAQATALLLERGLHAVSLAPVAPGDDVRSPASRRALAIAFESLASLVRAGVPLERALAATGPIADPSLRPALAEAREKIREGHGLAAALGASGGTFPPIVVAMVLAGERASQLSAALDEIARQLEQEAELAARLRAALSYPLLLLVAGMASVGVIVTVVVPKFAAILDDLGQQLPASTRLLLGASRVAQATALPLAVIGALTAVAVARAVRGGPGRVAWHRLLLRLPSIGPLRHALASSRFCRAFGGALQAGMPLLAAFDSGREAAADAAMDERFLRARQLVVGGEPLANSLTRKQALTPHALQLLAVGEASGQLGSMASRAGTLTAQAAERQLQSLVRLVEPALIVLFGGLVGLVATALLQAVYSIRPGMVGQ